MAGEKIEGFSVNIRNHLLATRELTIRGVSPTFDPSYRCTWSYRNGFSVSNGPGPFVPSEAWMADEEVEKYLGKAIARMRVVRKVRCLPFHISFFLFCPNPITWYRWISLIDDNEWGQRTVWDALKTLPNLRTLDLNVKYCQIPLPLDTIASLGDIHSITLKDVEYSRRSSQILDAFARMVAKSPKLMSMDLLYLQSSSRATEPAYSLHHAFKYWPSI